MTQPRILLVDDDRLILATLGKSLRDAGYEVVIADSGTAGLAQAASTSFDLAVLDMRMPGLSGIETAQALKERHGLPAIFLTAYGEPERVQQAVDAGALGYVVKPVEAAQLIPAIEAALARARDLAALQANQTQLETALAGGRKTSMAVGILMERQHLSEAAAFEHLRSVARQHRRKLEEHAGELVEALERFNGLQAVKS